MITAGDAESDLLFIIILFPEKEQLLPPLAILLSFGRRIPLKDLKKHNRVNQSGYLGPKLYSCLCYLPSVTTSKTPNSSIEYGDVGVFLLFVGFLFYSHCFFFLSNSLICFLLLWFVKNLKYGEFAHHPRPCYLIWIPPVPAVSFQAQTSPLLLPEVSILSPLFLLLNLVWVGH